MLISVAWIVTGFYAQNGPPLAQPQLAEPMRGPAGAVPAGFGSAQGMQGRMTQQLVQPMPGQTSGAPPTSWGFAPDNMRSEKSQDVFGGGDPFGKGAPDIFGKGAPDPFKSPADLFGKGVPDPFGKGASDMFSKGGGDVFGKGAPDIFGKGAPDLFSKGGNDIFGKGAGDLFSKGAGDLFGKGASDIFGKGAPDLFGKGAGDIFGKGTADLFGKNEGDASEAMATKVDAEPNVPNPPVTTASEPSLRTKESAPIPAEKSEQASAPRETPGFDELDGQTLGTLGLNAVEQQPRPESKPSSPVKVEAAVSADGTILTRPSRQEEQRWLSIESVEVSALMADAPPMPPARPASMVESAPQANTSLLHDWASRWAALFPDAADALLPGIGRKLHAAVLAAAPVGAYDAAWMALRQTLQAYGRGCWEDTRAYCKEAAPMGCLVQLTAKGSVACRKALAPSLFMSCMGELPDCGMKADLALPCMNESASPHSDCALAIEKVAAMEAELPAVLARAFGQLRQDETPGRGFFLRHPVPLLCVVLSCVLVLAVAWIWRERLLRLSEKESRSFQFLHPNNFFVTMRLHDEQDDVQNDAEEVADDAAPEECS